MPADVSSLPGWRKSRRQVDPAQVRIPTQRITINIDRDIIAFFKTEALHGGPPYQVAINQSLRRYLQDRETTSEERVTRSLLAALDDPSVRRKILAIRAGRGGKARKLAAWPATAR